MPCILFGSDTICFTFLCLHPVLLISGFRFPHSLSSFFISSLLLHSFYSSFFLHVLLFSLCLFSPSFLSQFLPHLLLTHVLQILLTSFLNPKILPYSFLSFFILFHRPSQQHNQYSHFAFRSPNFELRPEN